VMTFFALLNDVVALVQSRGAGQLHGLIHDFLTIDRHCV